MQQTSTSTSDMDEFSKRLEEFTIKKGDIIFSEVDLNDCTAGYGVYHHKLLDINSTENFTSVPPLEVFMDIPKPLRSDHFYKAIEKGNVVTGVITSIIDVGFYMNLIAVDVGKARSIHDLKLSAFCPSREVDKQHSHEDVLEQFTIKDVVRAVVIKVNVDKITVSLLHHHLPLPLSSIRLGILSDEEISLYYSRTLKYEGRTYNEILRRSVEYENPSNIANLGIMFGLSGLKCRPSLMRGLFRVKYPDDTYADQLRKKQSYKLAMKNVTSAVTYVKSDRNIEAMQMLNKALDIDPDNVEGLVVRGAIYGNTASYKKAIEDFDKALSLDPHHKNANKYLCSVLVNYAKILISENKTVQAMGLLRRASGINKDENLDDDEITGQVNELISSINNRKVHLSNKSLDDASDDDDDGRNGERLKKHSNVEKERQRRKSTTSLKNAASVVKYYSPVLLSDDDGGEVFGPQLPPRLQPGENSQKRKRKKMSRKRSPTTSSSSTSSSDDDASSSSSSSTSSSSTSDGDRDLAFVSKVGPSNNGPKTSYDNFSNSNSLKDEDLKSIKKLRRSTSSTSSSSSERSRGNHHKSKNKKTNITINENAKWKLTKKSIKSKEQDSRDGSSHRSHHKKMKTSLESEFSLNKSFHKQHANFNPAVQFQYHPKTTSKTYNNPLREAGSEKIQNRRCYDDRNQNYGKPKHFTDQRIIKKKLDYGGYKEERNQLNYSPEFKKLTTTRDVTSAERNKTHVNNKNGANSENLAGESLEDMESFLQELKIKQKMKK